MVSIYKVSLKTITKSFVESTSIIALGINSFSIQLTGEVDEPPLHMNPSSYTHSESQPSKEKLLPSSHCSSGSILELPQIGIQNDGVK